MKKKLAALAVAGLVLLGTVGCTSVSGAEDTATGEPTTLYVRTVELPDKRIVTCVVHSVGYQGGVSCDWDNAK